MGKDKLLVILIVLKYLLKRGLDKLHSISTIIMDRNQQQTRISKIFILLQQLLDLKPLNKVINIDSVIPEKAMETADLNSNILLHNNSNSHQNNQILPNTQTSRKKRQKSPKS